jgi:predicted GNAT family N-acyltransferase
MPKPDFTLLTVDDSTVFKSFDCNDSDLNDFLYEDSKAYKQELLATTFILENEDQIIAYYSILNDSIKIDDISFPSKNSKKSFLRMFVPHPKRHLKNYPAIKIGRLAVAKNIQKSGIGSQIIKFIISLAIEQNEKSACKCLLVDAYSKSSLFYENMGFKYFSESDKQDAIRQMYFDITPYLSTNKINT